MNLSNKAWRLIWRLGWIAAFAMIATGFFRDDEILSVVGVFVLVLTFVLKSLLHGEEKQRNQS